MGRRGPPPTPTKVKKRRGNPGKRPLSTAEPQPSGAAPQCPVWLSKEAKLEWARIVPLLEKMGLADAADTMALAGYCQAAAELILATRAIDKDGRFIKVAVRDRNGDKVGERLQSHPALVAQREAFNKLRAFLIEFGLSPAARARIGGPAGDGAEPETNDEVGQLIKLFKQPAG